MRKKILIVDDEPEMIEEISRRLEKNGYVVISAGNEAECFKRANEDKPDLILLDAVMPGRGGFGICKMLKQSDKTKDIPVIMVTSLFGDSVAKTGKESGASYLISKPFDPADLLWEIGDALKNKS